MHFSSCNSHLSKAYQKLRTLFLISWLCSLLHWHVILIVTKHNLRAVVPLVNNSFSRVIPLPLHPCISNRVSNILHNVYFLISGTDWQAHSYTQYFYFSNYTSAAPSHHSYSRHSLATGLSSSDNPSPSLCYLLKLKFFACFELSLIVHP